MQRSLDTFAGFKVNKKQVADFFNPFMNETVSRDPIKPAKPIEVMNILDAPDAPAAPPPALTPAPTVTLFPTSE